MTERSDVCVLCNGHGEIVVRFHEGDKTLRCGECQGTGRAPARYVSPGLDGLEFPGGVSPGS